MEKSEYYDNGIDTRNGLPYGETEDNTPFLDKVAKYMRDRHDHFVKTNGSTPKFAHVVVKFDENDTFDTFIKLRDFNPADTENDPDDENVIYYANGIDELCEINTDRTADFVILDILGFCDTYRIGEQIKTLDNMNEKKHLAEMTDEYDFINGNEIYEPTKYND